MGKLAEFLMLLIGPLVVRGLAAVGFTALVFTGVNELVNSLVANAQTAWSSMSFTILQLATIAGLPQMIGIIFGAYLGVFAMKAAVGASRYILKPK